MGLLRKIEVSALARARTAGIPAAVLQVADAIVQDVRSRGEAAVLEHVKRFNEQLSGRSVYLTRDDLERELERLPAEDRDPLVRIADRIESFAQAQRDSLTSLTVDVPGGQAGHTIEPLERAGCYAPGGRYPLPSSVLMAAVTARVAGVDSVWVASPRPAPLVLAAAAVAGADGLLTAGGAHAIAALAFGVGPVPPSDIVVGPGNLYVTAAKKIVCGEVAIDMLAGPSELVVLADHTSDPAIVAADLLAQAEHDDAAVPLLVTTHEPLVHQVEAELMQQLDSLPTAPTAVNALSNGGAVVCRSCEEAIAACNELAPEHLQLSLRDPDSVMTELRHYGGLFIGERSAEVFGDYGVGPNHVLPTGRTARSVGGLSVLTFLRVRTWLRCTDSGDGRGLIDDSAWLARQEGLEAHARAAEMRAVEGDEGR
jgi:phosphoribosyl-ATP pyrophosphohydrolase/phosphoribosyl-AMP cyclohydrolase/histidinol dehydrogenase